MKLAGRMHNLFPEAAYTVLAKAQALEKTGRSIIHFEIGQPDFSTPSEISNVAIQAIQQGKTKYTPALGILPLRQAVAEMISQSRKVFTNYHQIAITPSAKTALFVALASLVEPGDEVLYPDPGFPTYKTLIEFFGGKAIPLPLIEERDFSIDVDFLKKRFSKKTKLIILNSPSNPTSGIIPNKDLMEIAELVSKSDCWVLSDEIYNHLLYTDEPYASIYTLAQMKKRTIIVDGFSKTYAMTGWRLGHLVFPEVFEEKIDYLLTHLAGCIAAFTQEAGLAAVTGPQKKVTHMVKEYKKRRDYLVPELNNLPGISCRTPAGAFYVFPNIRGTGLSSDQFANLLLEKAGVALLPGTSFGAYGEGYVRICFATSLETIKEGLNRITAFLEKEIN